MRMLPAAALAALLLCPAAALAGPIPEDLESDSYPLQCREVVDGTAVDRGALRLIVDYVTVSDDDPGHTVPKGYTFAGAAGEWSWDGERARFDSGPLQGGQLSYEARRRTLPGEGTGRLYEATLTSAAGGEWACGGRGRQARRAIGGLGAYVARVAGVPVRVPRWFAMPSAGNPHGARALILKDGYYRIGLEDAIFSAKRAPASQLGHRTRVALGRGVVGWVGNYGCAFNGSDPDWGPRYCGLTAIVWHQAGVNYCLEAHQTSERDLVAAARQAVAGAPLTAR